MRSPVLFAIAALTVSCVTPDAYVQADDGGKSIADLDFLIGDWTGQSTFTYPREAGRTKSHEDVRAHCAHILKNTYIQCDTWWTNSEGRTRIFRLHFNYSKLDNAYQTLFVYDNWPRHVSYFLNYDEARNVYVGESDFEDAEGQGGRERIEWRVSADRRELHSQETNNLDGEPEDYWPKYFEFTWRKAD